MKPKLLFLILLLLLLTAGLAGCEDTCEDTFDVQKTILGKWELVMLQRSDGRVEPYNPTGFIEYLPDGKMQWFDYKTKKYEIICKYWFETYSWDNNTQLNLKYDSLSYYDSPDIHYGDTYEIVFINKNRFSLDCFELGLEKGPLYIYSRKK